MLVKDNTITNGGLNYGNTSSGDIAEWKELDLEWICWQGNALKTMVQFQMNGLPVETVLHKDVSRAIQRSLQHLDRLCLINKQTNMSARSHLITIIIIRFFQTEVHMYT